MAGIQKTISKGIAYLKKRGIRKTLRKTVLHIDRKRLEQAYVRDMMPDEETLKGQRETKLPGNMRFSVIVPLYNTPLTLLRETVDSVVNQSYENWELCLADGSDAAHGEVGDYCRERARTDPRILYHKLEKNLGISGNSNAALEMAGGEYIALFDHDDLLRADALFEMAKAIHETGADFLYSDEMIFETPKIHKVLGIRFKPDFTPEDLLTNNFICHLTVFRRELLEKTGGFRPDYDGSQDHDLVLRLTAAAQRIQHIPKVLYFWRSVPGSVAADIHMKEYAIDAGRRAVETFLRNKGREDIRVESAEYQGKALIVRGDGFNASSVVQADGEPWIRYTFRQYEMLFDRILSVKDHAYDHCHGSDSYAGRYEKRYDLCSERNYSVIGFLCCLYFIGCERRLQPALYLQQILQLHRKEYQNKLKNYYGYGLIYKIIYYKSEYGFRNRQFGSISFSYPCKNAFVNSSDKRNNNSHKQHPQRFSLFTPHGKTRCYDCYQNIYKCIVN